MKRHYRVLIILQIACVAPASGINWGAIGKALKKAGNAIKDAGNKIDSAFKDAGKEIEKTGKTVGKEIAARFKDTQLTRAIDYGIRLAALETALHTAELALKAAEKVTSGVTALDINVIDAGLKAGDGFLDKVVAKAAPGVLDAAAASGKGVLEGAKQTSVATLEGGKWVATNIVGQAFDINMIKYEGDLKSLEHGVLGNVAVKGTIAGINFSTNVDLDPQKLTQSLKPLVNELGKRLKSTFYDPFTKKTKTATSELISARTQAEQQLSAQPPAQMVSVGQKLQSMNAAFEAYAAEQNRLNDELEKTIAEHEQKLNAVATSTTQDLKNTIQKEPSAPTKDDATANILARQELARRALQTQ